MYSILLAALLGTALADPDITVDVGGSDPPLIFPQVISETSFSGPYQHVIILSVDGLHQVDLATYVSANPSSNFASLLKNSVHYTNARCSMPSDSFPGTMALFTGALPRTHGIWYDDTWSRDLYPFSANCSGTPGANVLNDESIDVNSTALDGGGGFNITHFTWAKTAWGGCSYVLPHNFVRSRTIFEVVRNNGGFTKVTDKHPAYEILNGPSGTGLYESYFPEINAIPTLVTPTEEYDDLHWHAVYNWTLGNFHNGTKDPNGVAHLYGSNFQAVSVAQKGFGYLNGSTSEKPIFGPNLTDALDFTDNRLGGLIDKLKGANIYDCTLLIVSAKHGQSPIDPTLSIKIPTAVLQNATSVEFAYVTADDGAYIWLVDPSPDNLNQAKSDLLKSNSTMVAQIYAGSEVYQNGFGDPRYDPRVPDLVVRSKIGVIYASPTAAKNMEHGGINPDDLTVAMFVHNPKLQGKTINDLVYTRQVAVTALEALGAPVTELDGAQADGTVGLPGLNLS